MRSLREVNKPLPPDRDEARYIVFDGDVDAVSGVRILMRQKGADTAA